MPQFKNQPVFSENDDTRAAAVNGVSHNVEGIGVYGESDLFNGVHGRTKSTGHAGVAGVSDTGIGTGVYGQSVKGEGVHGETQSPDLAAIVALMLNPEGVGAALHDENHGQGVGEYARGGRLAGQY